MKNRIASLADPTPSDRKFWDSLDAEQRNSLIWSEICEGLSADVSTRSRDDVYRIASDLVTRLER